jgi:hypothetical protein
VRTNRIVVPGIALLFVFASLSQNSSPRVRFPDPDIGVSSLPERAKAQREAASQFQVFHDFHFEDKVGESGITFANRPVDDAAKTYKPVHYDHGNGIAVADVDGDGLYDVYLLSETGGNQLWKNLGGGKFRNITEQAGVGMPDRISVAASFGDIDNDGDQDLFVTTVRGGNVLFENDGRGHFTDISAQAGVNLAAHSSGAVFFDFDNDGLLDLFVCNVGKYTSEEKGSHGEHVGLVDAFSGHMFPERYEYSVLYKNMGHNRFKDVTAASGLRPESWTGDASFTNLNGDGLPDLYVLNMMGANHYFENSGGGKFVDKTAQYFPRTSWGAMGIKFFDYDNDGRTDLFITDMHSDMFKELPPAAEKMKDTPTRPDSFLMGLPTDFVFGNALYHNLGNGRFREVSDAMGVENYWPWGPSIGDVNADGWEDIFIASSMNYPYRYGINSMLLNDHGKKFRDAEFLLGIEPRRGRQTHTPWFEADCSGSEKSIEVCKGRTGKITVMAPLGSRSSVLFDLDNDGDLDLITNDFNSASQVLISNLAEHRTIHWLKVVLQGTRSNRNGFGAKVWVRAGKQTYARYLDGKSGYLSQSVLPLYFGLGDADTIDSIEVDWPSGTKQSLTHDLRANQIIGIREPESPSGTAPR